MANSEHLAVLKQGVEVWNQWRTANPGIRPDLSQADLPNEALSEADFDGADLTWAILSHADLTQAGLFRAELTRALLDQANLTQADLGEAYLSKAFLTGVDLTRAYLASANLSGAFLAQADFAQANLSQANLSGASLRAAILTQADLSEATLIGADLTQADLVGANLSQANLSQANLSQAELYEACLFKANLESAILVETSFVKANLTGCRVYGISAWRLDLIGAQQSDLVITRPNEPVITVDNVEVAQFIYLLLHNEKLRHVIETVTSKAVLILGRFTPDRKAVLDALREELRRRDRVPIVFDFPLPATQTTLETILTLAHMARYVIADLTDAKFDFFRSFPWVLQTYRYYSLEEVLASLDDQVIAPVEAKVQEREEARRAPLSGDQRRTPHGHD